MSRALKFHSGNMDRWIAAMGLRDGMRILEVGCAGGLLCHRLKEKLPAAEITGLDFDTGHIAYALEKTQELGLDCDFVAGDACELPFADASFDVCCSHTVMNFCDPEKFVREQHRVLKPGGRMIVMDVYNRGAMPEEWVPTEDCEEFELYDKVWEAASKNPASDIKRFENNPERYFPYLTAQGFRNISLDAVAAVKYAPDCDNVDDEMALAQINEDRISELCSAEKALALAPDALSEAEFRTLQNMINLRYDEKIRRYEAGEKTWAFRIATTYIISGTK